MAFQLIVSNSLNSLADQLSSRIQTADTVFRPVYVVTQTDGMNSWLKFQIAQKLGIAANIQFIKPNDVINRIYQILGGTYKQSISTHDMNWLLFKILGEEEFTEKYKNIAAYYDYSGVDRDIKRMALAEKIADLFDQYQIYRTDMIEEWNRGEGEEHWQKWLWIKAREMAGDDFPDKTMVGKFILESLEQPEKVELLKQKLPTVYFFGLSLITSFHLQVFYGIAQHIDLNFLMQNPAPNDYWFEDKSEKTVDFLKRINYYPDTEKSDSNPLLTTWGKLIQDTFMMMFENEDALNNYTTIDLVEPSNETLLQSIQNSIFNNQKAEIQFNPTQLQDGTIQVNSCYSPVREVEVLYNYLVGLVDRKNEDLSARDIVVMVSDIDLYASYIRAVFDNAPYRFRYTIADESYAVSDSISNTLLEILSLNESQLTSEKVMSLLEFSALKRQFQIHNVMLMRELVASANIRFGVTGNSEDDTQYVSWKYGLKRLMYGLCMSGGEEFGEGEDSFYPMDAVEGYNMFEVVRLTYFVEVLIDSIEKRKKKRTISEWVEYVEDTLITFIGISEEVQDEDYVLLLNQLERYNVLQDLFDEKVSFEVFQHNFLPILSGSTRSGSFASGGITFCSLIPMRSIPFKVVALLGMNFDKFPRLDRRQSFDLMTKEKRRGDRNVKENDKHLFLETLLSAEDYLYISYIGQSVKDNTSLPPSVLIDELIDFVSTRSEDPDEARENFIQKHPLHGFSKRYNSGNENLYSYLLDNKKELPDLFKDKIELDFDFDEIEINRLVSFLKDPVSAYYKRVLNVYYEDEDYSLKETELFSLDHLQQWSLKNDLLHLDEEVLDEYRIRLLKTGQLPLKNMSEVVLEKTLEDTAVVKELFEELADGAESESLEIDLEIDGSRIIGKIDGIYDGDLIRYVFSKGEGKYVLEAYLHYLIATAAGADLNSYFISNTKGEKVKSLVMNQIEAQAELKKIVEIYKKGHHKILPFSMGWIKEVKDIVEWDLPKVQKKINDYFDNYNFPSDNQYHIRERANGLFAPKEFYEEFKTLAELLMVKPYEIIYPN